MSRAAFGSDRTSKKICPAISPDAGVEHARQIKLQISRRPALRPEEGDMEGRIASI